MLQRLHPVTAFLTGLAFLGLPAVHATPQAPSAPAPLDLVPVNVHVVDRSGKPPTDLKQEDFTVLEACRSRCEASPTTRSRPARRLLTPR